MKHLLFSTILLVLFIQTKAQTPLSAIRGTVIDQQSQFPIPGATILLMNSDPIKGTVTDGDGNFRLDPVEVGRQSIQVNYLGYAPQVIANLLVITGKDLEVNIQLVELVTEMSTVEITAKEDKSDAKNEMSLVSTRSFSVEEAKRYAGTLQDPARMAQNYAGVSNASDDRNDIIIRGNSPTGVLWRLDGIDIPSPNHFATLGTTGGPISLLNINNLSNSDFSTGAFAPEYGNALSGVFDLRLRSGNKDKREYTGQLGFNGVELGAEGPFKKGGQASYIVNGRYSFLDILTSLGVDFGTGSAVPEYQDVTFKIDLPTAKAGRFTVFGIGGNSFIDFKADQQGENNLYAGDEENQQFHSTTGILGLSHSIFLSGKTQSKFVIGATTSGTEGFIDTLDVAGDPHRTFGINQRQNNLTAHYSINSKLNVKNTIKVGVLTDNYSFDIVDSVLYDGSYFFRQNDFNGNATLGRAYASWQLRPNDKWTFNTGVYMQHLFYNNKSNVEPRIAARFAFNEKQSVNVGAGLHSQLQPIPVYFNREELDNGSVVANNKNLDFNKAAHLVLGYDHSLSSTLRVKTELYYQHLYNIAVDTDSSSFSMLNTGADFTLPNNGNLVNEGTGTNYGVEITIEKFLSKGFYFLFTTSLFESNYKGSDGIKRNTAFNGQYVFNLLAGKEWKIRKNNALSIDFKSTYAGGRWFAPIELEASLAESEEVRNWEQNNSEQYAPYFRTDFKIGYRINGKKISQSFALDIRNVSSQQNVFIQNYNPRSGNIETVYQTGFFPIVLYNIYF